LYFAGEKGANRVRLHAHRSGTMMLEYKGNDGKRVNRSLRHADVARGKVAADELAATLRSEDAAPAVDLTLGVLFDKYDEEVTKAKRPAKQRHDRAARALFEKCWGKGTAVADLDRTHWDRFIRERRSGRLRPPKGSENGVRNRQIQYDLKFLMAVCNWAVNVIENRRPLLERNPFRNYPMPKENSPRRPRVTEKEYGALVAAAQRLGPHVSLFLHLCHETGHRSKSVSLLRWTDVDLQNGEIVWRGEHDKMKREHRTPLTQQTLDLLKAVRLWSAHVGDCWLFPSPEDAEKPISRREIVRWWSQLERRAELSRTTGRGWHSLRRKFADDNDDLPLSQLMALGGWKSSKTIVETYQAPDVEKLRTALERRTARCAAKRAATTTRNDNPSQNAVNDRF
jgi:integrase